MDKKITFAHVYTQDKDRGKIERLNLQVDRTSHILSGLPYADHEEWIGMHAENDYGHDDEPVGLRIITPPAPILYNRSAATDSDIGINLKLNSNHTSINPRECIRWVHWSASGLPSGLSINPDTGYISGLCTRGGVHNSTITVETNAGKASATFTLTVTEYTFLTRTKSEDCPVTPGSYAGTHPHGVTVTVPFYFKSIKSLYNRSTVSYGGRVLHPKAEPTGSTSIVDYYNITTKTNKKTGKVTETKKKVTTSAYQKVCCTMNITAGRKKSDRYSQLYKNAHFMYRVKILEYVPKMDQESRAPRGCYIDVDATYDFYEEPGFSYDNYGEIKTYS